MAMVAKVKKPVDCFQVKSRHQGIINQRRIHHYWPIISAQIAVTDARHRDQRDNAVRARGPHKGRVARIAAVDGKRQELLIL